MQLALTPELLHYAEQYSAPETPVLAQIRRNTHLHTVKPYDASDFGQGRLLALLSQLLRPQTILEIGTFTAYATVCMSEGLAEGGHIHTIEHDKQLSRLIDEHLALATIADCTTVHYGAALDILPKIRSTFDMVFMDAAKREYAQYFDIIIDRISPGGLLIADNILWKGQVCNTKRSRIAEALHQFNVKVEADPRVAHFILPYRDGLSIMRKL